MGASVFVWEREWELKLILREFGSNKLLNNIIKDASFLFSEYDKWKLDTHIFTFISHQE